MTDYSELKMLAEKATPGPWWIDSHGMTMMSMSQLEVVFNHPAQSIAVRNEETGNLSHWRNGWDASYIATANPKTILALLAEIEALRRERKGKVHCDLELFETLRDSANSEADEHRQCMATYRPLRQASLDSVVKKCDDLLAAMSKEG